MTDTSNAGAVMPSRRIIARAPTRIDFGGGWTDVPPWSTEQGGHVCNVAIARYATARISAREAGGENSTAGERPLVAAAVARSGVNGIAVDLESDYPEGAGLGGSSAAGVALCGALAAWRGESLAPGDLAELSRAVEAEDLGVAGGRQDHYAASFGGALGLTFGDGVKVQRIGLTPAFQGELERRCLVVYTGQSRISAETVTAVLDAYRARDARVVRALHRMKELAMEMTRAIGASNGDELGELVREHWELQRSLHPGIPTPLIDEIISRADGAGALGAKALGASGGGCVLCIASEESAEQVRRAIASLAAPLVFTIDRRGFHATVTS
jgi:D-glycero-alpha-D-manno-heptose-7-phosphate kinase